MGSHLFGMFRGIKPFQGFLGGAKWISSTESTVWLPFLLAPNEFQLQTWWFWVVFDAIGNRAPGRHGIQVGELAFALPGKLGSFKDDRIGPGK